MIRHVGFADINERHLALIAKSLEAAPADVRPEPSDLIRAVMMETMRLFDWDTGCVLVGVRDGRLIMFAFCTEPGLMKDHCRMLAQDLCQLAADWQCDKIETICFDTRLASVIKHLGGRVESQTLVMSVEAPDGRD